MKKTKCFLLLVVAVLAATASSCVKDEEWMIGETEISTKPGSANVELANIPFADDQTLHAIAQNSANISYSVARKLAMVELEMNGMKEEMKWDGTKLSPKPVVIYEWEIECKVL